MQSIRDRADDIRAAIATFKYDDDLDSESRRDLATLLRRIAIDQDIRAGLLKFRRPRKVDDEIK